MGMFDQIRNDYKPLGPEFQGVLQTKDLDNLMDWYYIDPSGKLSLVEYSGTQDFVPRECNDRMFPLMNWKPNGNHGRVMACTLTDTVVVYPEKWDGDWNQQPECCIHFVNGQIRNFYYGKHFQIGSTGRKAVSFKKEGGCCSTEEKSCDCDCGKS